jgi:8-oxo-dGTP pyrophosphatase MutT (NUDIX family)
MRLREDRFRRADGEEGLYAVVEKAPAALVIPLDGDHLWLVEQYRHPVGRRYWEFPQGALDDGSEASAEEIARRELREETGLRAGRLERLGRVYFAYGISNQPCDVWLATELEPGEAEPEPEELDLRSARVPVDRFEEMVRAGEIVDAASVAAWTLRRL